MKVIVKMSHWGFYWRGHDENHRLGATNETMEEDTPVRATEQILVGVIEEDMAIDAGSGRHVKEETLMEKRTMEVKTKNHDEEWVMMEDQDAPRE